MANSYIEYNQNLSETTYDVPFNVLSIDDVNVKGYNGSAWSDLTIFERSASAKTVTLDAAPSAYNKIRVWRNTSTTQLVDFQNGSRLSESDLDTAYQQGLFVAQEVSENASTEVEGVGQQGLQGIQGPAGADGVDGTDPFNENGQLVNFTETGSGTYLGHANSGTFPKVSAIGMGSDAVSLTHTSGGASFALTGSVQIAAIQSTDAGAPTDLAFYTNSSGTVTERLRIKGDGTVIINSIPTSSTGLPSGAIYSDGGTLKIV